MPGLENDILWEGWGRPAATVSVRRFALTGPAAQSGRRQTPEGGPDGEGSHTAPALRARRGAAGCEDQGYRPRRWRQQRGEPGDGGGGHGGRGHRERKSGVLGKRVELGGRRS